MKKFKTLTILTALLLLISTPIFAQTADDPMDPDATTQQEETVETEANAQLQADADEGVEASAEASVNVEDEADLEAETDDDFDDDELPQTASPLALLALLGSAGAGTAFGLRRLRK